MTIAAKKRRKVNSGTWQIPTDWKGLVSKLCLLRPIRTKGDYNQALHIIDRLAGRTNLTKDQADYLESLSTLAEAYEDEHEPIKSTQNPIEVLEFLLRENGLNGSDLGRILGQRQLGSKILKGKRALSKAHIEKLAQHFSVSPALFFRQ